MILVKEAEPHGMVSSDKGVHFTLFVCVLHSSMKAASSGHRQGDDSMQIIEHDTMPFDLVHVSSRSRTRIARGFTRHHLRISRFL